MEQIPSRQAPNAEREDRVFSADLSINAKSRLTKLAAWISDRNIPFLIISIAMRIAENNPASVPIQTDADTSLCCATSLHHKSLAVRKNHDRRKRPVKKCIDAECFKCKTLPCCELAQVIVLRDPHTADRISLCRSGKGK